MSGASVSATYRDGTPLAGLLRRIRASPLLRGPLFEAASAVIPVAVVSPRVWRGAVAVRTNERVLPAGGAGGPVDACADPRARARAGDADGGGTAGARGTTHERDLTPPARGREGRGRRSGDDERGIRGGGGGSGGGSGSGGGVPAALYSGRAAVGGYRGGGSERAAAAAAAAIDAAPARPRGRLSNGSDIDVDAFASVASPRRRSAGDDGGGGGAGGGGGGGGGGGEGGGSGGGGRGGGGSGGGGGGGGAESRRGPPGAGRFDSVLTRGATPLGAAARPRDASARGNTTAGGGGGYGGGGGGGGGSGSGSGRDLWMMTRDTEPAAHARGGGGGRGPRRDEDRPIRGDPSGRYPEFIDPENEWERLEHGARARMRCYRPAAAVACCCLDRWMLVARAPTR